MTTEDQPIINKLHEVATKKYGKNVFKGVLKDSGVNWYNIINGPSTPGLASIIKVCRLLGVPLKTGDYEFIFKVEKTSGNFKINDVVVLDGIECVVKKLKGKKCLEFHTPIGTAMFTPDDWSKVELKK